MTIRPTAPNTPPMPRLKELALLVCKLAFVPVFVAPPVESACSAGTIVVLVTVFTAPLANVVVKTVCSVTELRTEAEVDFPVVSVLDMLLLAPIGLLDDVSFFEDEDNRIEEEEV